MLNWGGVNYATLKGWRRQRTSYMKRRAAETYRAIASAYTDRFIPTVALLMHNSRPTLDSGFSHAVWDVEREVQRSGRVHARLCGADLAIHTDGRRQHG
jgi:hypothetical protein